MAGQVADQTRLLANPRMPVTQTSNSRINDEAMPLIKLNYVPDIKLNYAPNPDAVALARDQRRKSNVCWVKSK